MASGTGQGTFSRQLRVGLLLLSTFVALHAAQARLVQAADKNTLATSHRPVTTLNTKMRATVKQVMRKNARAQALISSGALCAIAIISGPDTSFDIRFGLFNVIDQSLDTAILDSFHALGGAALLHSSVSDPTDPQGGTLTVEYPPDEAGRGPVVLSFTDFDRLESASFNTDPDTYDDPTFSATVKDLDGTTIEVVYDAATPESQRCEGTFAFDASQNASIAFITQVFP